MPAEETRRRWEARASRMTDEHLVWTIMSTTDVLREQPKLSSGTQDLIAVLKAFTGEALMRWAPEEALEAGSNMWAETQDVGDLSYLAKPWPPQLELLPGCKDDDDA
jgi:hypothetical protein